LENERITACSPTSSLLNSGKDKVLSIPLLAGGGGGGLVLVILLGCLCKKRCTNKGPIYLNANDLSFVGGETRPIFNMAYNADSDEDV
jgi:hypothetical protein